MTPQRQPGSAGFTLTEVMVALSVGTVIIAAVLTTYLMSLKGLNAVANYVEIHADGRMAIDWFSRDMRAASGVVSMPNSSNITVSIPTYPGTKTVQYHMNSGKLLRTETVTNSVTSQLAANIYQLDFSLYDRLGNFTTVLASAKGVQVRIRLRKYVMSQIQSEDFLSARLDMRNTL